MDDFLKEMNVSREQKFASDRAVMERKLNEAIPLAEQNEHERSIRSRAVGITIYSISVDEGQYGLGRDMSQKVIRDAIANTIFRQQLYSVSRDEDGRLRVHFLFAEPKGYTPPEPGYVEG